MSISASLERIERYSSHVINDARSVSIAVRELAHRFDFETNADDALQRAEAELMNSLHLIRDARKNYSAKPVTA